MQLDARQVDIFKRLGLFSVSLGHFLGLFGSLLGHFWVRLKWRRRDTSNIEKDAKIQMHKMQGSMQNIRVYQGFLEIYLGMLKTGFLVNVQRL